jgi:tetratricopeptide (TPR) repeat protein
MSAKQKAVEEEQEHEQEQTQNEAAHEKKDFNFPLPLIPHPPVDAGDESQRTGDNNQRFYRKHHVSNDYQSVFTSSNGESIEGKTFMGEQANRVDFDRENIDRTIEPKLISRYQKIMDLRLPVFENPVSSAVQNDPTLALAWEALVTQRFEPLLQDFLTNIATLLPDDFSLTCFISYAWPKLAEEHNIQPCLLRLVEHLKTIRIRAFLDLLDLKPGSHINSFMEKGIELSQAVMIMGTTTYYQRSEQETNVRYEFERILKTPKKALLLAYSGTLSTGFQDKLSPGNEEINLTTPQRYFFDFPILVTELIRRHPSIAFTFDEVKARYLNQCSTLFSAITYDEIVTNKQILEHQAKEAQIKTRQRVLDLAERLPRDQRMIPEHWYLEAPSALIVERETCIKTLGDLFQTTPNSILVVTGQVGIGKKQTVLSYAQQYCVRYTFGALIHEGDIASLLTLLRFTSIDGLTNLLTKQPRWLLIFSDLDDFSLIAPFLSLKNGDVLVTSSTYTERNSPYPTLMIPPLTTDASVALLTKLTCHQDPAWATLAECLHYLPKDLEQIALYAQRNLTISVSELIEWYQEKAGAMWEALKLWNLKKEAHVTSAVSTSSLLRDIKESSQDSELDSAILMVQRLYQREIDKFTQLPYFTSLSQQQNVSFSYVWDSTNVQFFIFMEELVRHLKQIGITTHYHLHQRVPSAQWDIYQSDTLQKTTDVILLGTPRLETEHGRNLFLALEEVYRESISSTVSPKRTLIPLRYDGDFMKIFPPNYRELLIEDVKGVKAYAKAFPRLVGQIYNVSHDIEFKKESQAYLDTLTKIEEGIDKEAIEYQAWQIREQETQERKRNELAIRQTMDALNYSLEPQYWFLPAVNLSVGRKDLLQELTMRFSREQALNDLSRVIISGLGGVGKSHSALRYAQEHRSRYTLGALLNGASTTTYYTSCKELGEYLKLPLPEKADDVVAYMKAYFERPINAGWLLMVDNADQPDELKDVLPKQGGHLLVTSRSHEWLSHEVLEVPTLDRSSAVELLKAVSGLQLEEGADALSEYLGDLPLSLTQAAAYMRENSVPSFREYLNIIQQLSDVRSVFASTWLVTMQKIKEQNPEALSILKKLSCLAPDNIPIEFISNWFKEEINTAQKQGGEKNWVFKDQAGKAIDALLRYSMITATDRKNIHMHRLVQTTIRDLLTKDEKEETDNFLFKQFERQLTYNQFEPTTWPFSYALASHLDVFLLWIQSNPTKNKSRQLILFNILGVMCINQGYIEKAQNILQNAYNEAVFVYGTNSLEVSRASFSLGLVFFKLGKLKDAETHYEQALTILEKIHGKEHRDLAVTHFCLGNAFSSRGDYQKAKKYLEQALTFFESLHDDMADTFLPIVLCSVGDVLGKLGHHGNAKTYVERALSIQERIYGMRHFLIAKTLILLGKELGKLGQYIKERDYYEQALSINEKAFDSAHPDVAEVLYCLGDVSIRLEQHDRARTCIERASIILEKVFGPDHPHMALLVQALGSVYFPLREYEKAHACFKRAVEIKEKQFGEDHPDVAILLCSLSGVCGGFSQKEEQRMYIERALSIVNKMLGENHPLTAYVLREFGAQLGVTDKGIKCLEQALSIQQRTYGENHIEVAKTLQAFGAMYLGSHRFNLAKSYFERSLSIQENTFDTELPGLATTLDGLGLALQSLNQHEESLKYYQRAYEIQQKTLGPNSVEVAKILKHIGLALQILGKDEEARSHLQQALIIEENFFEVEKFIKEGKKSICKWETLHYNEASLSLNSLGSLFHKMGQFENAKNHFEKSLIILKRLQEIDPEIVNGNTFSTLLVSLGNTLKTMGRFEEAIHYFMQAVEIQEKSEELAHPHLSTTLSLLGETFGCIAQFEKAKNTLMRALAIQERFVGREHPSISKTLTALGNIFLNISQYEEAKLAFERALPIFEQKQWKEENLLKRLVSQLQLPG